MKHRPIWKEGMLDSLPVCASFVFVFSGVGALTRQVGLSLWQSAFSTITIFAAPLQAFVAGLLHDGPITLLLSATLLANFRFALMSTVLKRYFAGVSRWKVLLSMVFLSASTYAVTHAGLSARKLSGQKQFAYFLAVSVPCYGVAVVASITGYVFLSAQHDSLLSHLAIAVLPVHFASLAAKRKAETGVLACTVAGMAVAPLLAESHAISLNILAPLLIGFGAALLTQSSTTRSMAC